MSTPLRSVRVRTDVTRVLVVTAHPDDVDFAAAGTVARWTEAGIEVAYCICTSGDAGGFDATPRHEMGPLREAEQRAVAQWIEQGRMPQQARDALRTAGALAP